MKVQKIIIKNFKSIRHLEIEASESMNVIVGVNGAGKSTLLQALSVLFSWFISRMKNVNGKGIGITPQDICIEGEDALLQLQLKNNISWSVYKQRPDNRKKPTAKTDLIEMTHYANALIESYTSNPKNASLPLITNYSVNRSVIDIPVRVRKKHELEPLSIYNTTLINGIQFRSFFEWFREREDIENESIRYEKNATSDKQLDAVRTAIRSILPEYGELRVRRNPRAIILNKKGQIFKVDQLSDGEKCYLTLIADIARRLATANPSLENPLLGSGIILIDEIDLHLHPSWQMNIIPKMKHTFPNCQFFITTHSPYIVSDIRSLNHEKLILLDNGSEIQTSLNPFGKNVESILTDFFQMETTRNNDTQKHLDNAWKLLGKHNYNSKDFTSSLKWLEENIGESDKEIARIKAEKNKLMKLDSHETH